MKQILLTLFSILLSASAQAKPLNATSNQIIYNPGSYGVINDSTPTYALNSVTSSVSSSAVDLSTTGSIVVCISGTAGTSPLVSLWYGNTTASMVTNGPYQLGAGCWPVERVGRYVKFQAVGASLTARTSLNYFVVSAPPTTVTIGNAITVSGGVSITAVSSGVSITVNNTDASAVPVRITGSTAVSATIAAVSTGVSITVNNTDASAIPVRITGTTAISGAVTCAACSTAANQTTQITAEQGAAGSLTFVAAATIVANPSAITFGARTVGWVSLTQTSYAGVTTNATSTINVTATAGSAAYSAYMVRLTVESGVTSMRAVYTNSVTAPTTFSATAGPTYFPSDTPKTLGILVTNPLTGVVGHVHLRASALSGVTSATVFIEIFGQL